MTMAATAQSMPCRRIRLVFIPRSPVEIRKPKLVLSFANSYYLRMSGAGLSTNLSRHFAAAA
jgi:hypothetical protein